MMKQLLTIFILVFGLSAANAATWYVATTGSDANAGTFTSPKLTINGAISAASDGDVIRVANGTYASAVTVSKRVTIVGQSNNLTTGTIITQLVTISATGGSAANRVVIDNVCVRNTTGSGNGINIQTSYVTVKNSNLSYNGGTFTINTANAGFAISIPTGTVSYRDIIIKDNYFSYQRRAINVGENVRLNEGVADEFRIEGNHFFFHYGFVIYFEETVFDGAATDGKIANTVMKNNVFQQNRNTDAGNQQSINLLKGGSNLTIENVTVFDTLTQVQSQGSRHAIQLRPHFQGDESNAIFKDIRLKRSSARGTSFFVGIYVQPQNTTATYGTTLRRSSLSGLTFDGIYEEDYYCTYIVDQFVNGPITTKNCFASRSTASEPCFIAQPGFTLNATMSGCPSTSSSHIFNNNFTGISTAISGFKRTVSYSTSSPTLTVVDPFCSRNNNFTDNNIIGLTPVTTAAIGPAVTAVTNTTITLGGNATATSAGNGIAFYDLANFANTSYVTQLFESRTITNHQANRYNVTTSGDTPVGSYTTPNNAIAAASAGDIIRGFEDGATLSSVVVDKNLTFNIHGSDRFENTTSPRFEALQINGGATLTLKGDMFISTNVTINGTLDLNGFVLNVGPGASITYGSNGAIKGSATSGIVYNATANSDLKMAAGFESLDFVHVRNSGNLTLSTNLTIGGIARFSHTGNLVVGANTLTITGSGITASSSGGLTSTSSSNLAINSKYPVVLPAAVTALASLSIDGGADVIGGASLSIGALTVTSGNYTIGAGNTLTVTGTAAYTAGNLVGSTTSNLVVNTTGASTIAPITGGVQDLTLNASGGTVTFNGDVTVHRDYAHTAGSASYPARFRVNRNITYTAGTLIGGAATSLVFEGTPTATNTLPEIAPFVKSFELNRASGTFNLGGTLRVTDSLRLTSGVLTLNGNNLRFSGNQVSGSGTITGDASASIYMLPSGAGLFSLPFTGGVATLDSVDVNLPTNVAEQTISSALTVNRFNVSRGLVNLGSNIVVNTAANISSDADIDFGNFIISGTGSFTSASGSTLIIGSADGISSSGATGNVQVSGTRTYNAGSIYYYNGSAAQVTGNGLPSSVGELVIDNSSHVSLSSDVSVTSLITFNAGRLNLSSSRLSYSSNSATDLNLAGGSNAKLSLLGSNGNVNLNFLASAELNDLVINRSGNPTINLNDPLLVNGTMALTAGVLSTSTANELTLADGATYTGGSNSSFVSGPMRKTGDDAFVFPTGKAGRFSQVAISAPANVTSQFEAEYFASNSTITPDNLDMGTGLFSVSGKEYWNLNRIVGSDAVSVTLHWNANDLTIKSTLSDLRVAHYDGNKWNSEGGTSSGTISVGTVTSSAPVTSFSPFTIGSENGSNPLPVTLTKFTGRNVNGQAHLFWTTAAELNNSGFEIMKSTDGKNWSVIGFVKGVGTSNKVNNYAFTDANLVYNSFYKLRQVDFDGKTTDSKSITINANTTELSAVAYPNPFNNSLSLTIAANKTEKGKVTVLNVVGKVVSEMEVNLVNGANITELELANLPKGVYTVRVNQTNEVATLKVVKK